MSHANALHDILARIDGRPYPSFRDTLGTSDFGGLSVIVDHVQGDPFAAPSHVRLRAPWAAREAAGLPARGRRVLGHEAWSMFEDIVAAGAVLVPGDGLEEHVRSVRRHRGLRGS